VLIISAAFIGLAEALEETYSSFLLPLKRRNRLIFVQAELASQFIVEGLRRIQNKRHLKSKI
jgi:hypothetical protein